jgi:hypothetical protein
LMIHFPFFNPTSYIIIVLPVLFYYLVFISSLALFLVFVLV